MVQFIMVAVFGLIASGLINNADLEKGKVRIDKKVVAERQHVDYSKMNN